jgi:hypothetical protein
MGPNHDAPRVTPSAAAWVWVGACCVMGAAAALVAFDAGVKQVSLANEADTNYTAWVAWPTFIGFGLTAFLLVATAPVTAAVRNARTRRGGVLALAGLAALCVTVGGVETHERRDITPRLVSAVRTVPNAAVDVRPVRVMHEGGDDYLGVLSVPSATREWSYPDTSRSATCAAVARDFTGPRWVEDNDSDDVCDLHAADGLVELSVDPLAMTPGSSRYAVELIAQPAGAD